MKGRARSQVWPLTSTHAPRHMFMCAHTYKPTCVHIHTCIRAFTHHVHTKNKSQNQTNGEGEGNIRKQLGHEYSILKNNTVRLLQGCVLTLGEGLVIETINSAIFLSVSHGKWLALPRCYDVAKSFLQISGILLLDLPTY